jgi:succinate dehydrogenase / fumarate reductase cytochrome b subunit
MGVTGLFLVLFVAVHLTINLMLIFDDSGVLFNSAANFMRTNLIVKLIEPLLGLGFFIHIMWSFFLEYQNYKARPVRYNKKISGESSTWASRNMLIIGLLVLIFLVIHIMNFFWVIKFQPEELQKVNIGGVFMEDSYTLIADLFKSSIVYDLLYILAGILLGIHLSHGFWSAFQTLGLSNKHWLGRFQMLSKIYAIIVAIGFSIIPIYFLIKF